MLVQSMVLVDASGKVAVDLVYYLFNVGPDLLVIAGDVGILGVICETVNVIAAVVVDHRLVPATLVYVVKS